MPYSGGVYTFPSNSFTPTPVFNTVIDETAAAASWSDLATALSTCVLKDGTQTITANIPMSTFKLTGLGAGSALTDSATLRQVQYGFGSFLTSVAGTNTITATATPTPAYTVGQRFTFVPAVTNTGATTLNISSVGAGAVQLDGAALVGGELEAGMPVTVYVTAATPVFEIVSAGQPRNTLATTFTFDGSGGSTGSLTVTWQKIHNFVTLNIPVATATTGTGSTKLASDTALPAAIRPTIEQTQNSCSITNNGAATTTPGMIRIQTDGIIAIYRDSAVTAYTNTAVGGSGVGTSITYFLG